MLILSADQIKEVDEFTIKNEPILSVELMNRAAAKCVDFLLENFSKEKSFVIVCGPGNNGGDGLAIARFLKEKERIVFVFLIGEKFSEDNREQQKLLQKAGIIITEFSFFEKTIGNCNCIIDCLFGYGLTRKPEGQFADCIFKINKSQKTVVSIDMPSGMFTDRISNVSSIVRANVTLTFQFPKLSFLLPETGIFTGKVEILNINLMETGYSGKPLAEFIVKENISGLFPKRNLFSHKGTFGHAVLIGGSKGKTGAIQMAVTSCLRTGAGLTTVFSPEIAQKNIQEVLPEAMLGESKGFEFIEEIHLKELKYNAIGIGPGLGVNVHSRKIVLQILQENNFPRVFDADALNVISENDQLKTYLNSNCILTPHPGEFKRLAGEFNDSFEMIEKQKSFSTKYQCIVVLKGRFTTITDVDGSLFFNSTGNPGLAKGGSGDTLTGIITSLLAQGLCSKDAAVAGVYLHGLAADLAAKDINEMSLLATDVSQYISEAINQIQS